MGPAAAGPSFGRGGRFWVVSYPRSCGDHGERAHTLGLPGMPRRCCPGRDSARSVDVTRDEPWLVRHPTEWRQVGIVTTYIGLLALMYFVPATRNLLTFTVACLLSFLKKNSDNALHGTMGELG